MNSKTPSLMAGYIDFEALEGMHVVLVGNPLDGFTIFGPFQTGEDAHKWADDEVDDDWFAAALHAPDSEGDLD